MPASRNNARSVTPYSSSVRSPNYSTPGSSVWRRTPTRVSRFSTNDLLDIISTGANFTPAGRALNSARTAYSLGKKAYQMVRGTQTSKPVKTKWSGASTGIYAGKFKKPKKVVNTFESQALAKGYSVNIETHGRVNDPNTCYIGHSTAYIGLYAETILGCLLRKVLSKAGFVISNRASPINAFAFGNGDGFWLEMIVKDPVTGAVTSTVTYDTVSGSSLDSITIGWAAALNVFIDFFSQSSDNVPYRLILHSSDRNVLATNERLAAELLIGEEIIEMKCKSELTVQNRSAGASAAAGNLDLDRVDSQPVKVHLYEFSQATPRLKDITAESSYNLVSSLPSTGIGLVRSAQLETTMQDAPVAQIWSNCKKKSYSILQPGQIKKITIIHMFRGKLVTIMKRMRPVKLISGVISGGAGKSQLLCLEEKLRTDETNPITIQYERDFECYALCKKSKQVPITKKLFINTLNNTV